MNPKSAVTVVGGGLAGGLVSIFLARLGYSVTLYESRPDMRREDMSAGRSINLALANRGLTPLKRVGLGDKVEELLTTMRGRMIHEVDGTTNLQPYGQRDWEVRTEIVGTDHPWMRRVEVGVYELVDGEAVGPVDQLVAFVGQN